MFLVATIATALVASSVGATLAQSSDDVREAERALDEARENRTAAEDAVGATTHELVEVFTRYQEITTTLDELSFSIADTIDATRTAESDVRSHRTRIHDAVRTAYVAGSGQVLAAVFDTGSWSDAVYAGRVAERTTMIDGSALADLESSRERLGDKRAELEAMQASARDLQVEANQLVGQLEAMVDEATVNAAFAVDAEVSAQEHLDETEALYEAAKNSVNPRVLRWQPLVERFFPPGLVWAALQVIDCESWGNPYAVNPDSGATGLFQFKKGTWILASTGAGYAGARRTNPEASVASAAWLVKRSQALDHPRGAFGHWSCQPLPGYVP